jgi:hypothetical protein
MTVSPSTGLARFNMPFELGLFLGAHAFGDRRQKAKACLVLDIEPRRYQAALSDIAGQDIKAHHNTVQGSIQSVRDWLRAQTQVQLPGPAKLAQMFDRFQADLPGICRRHNLTTPELTYHDYVTLVAKWLAKQQATSRAKPAV